MTQPDIGIVGAVGAGIGGLAVAAFLRRPGLACALYEQAAALTEIGAGLVVAPNAARLLRRLGVLDAFARQAVRLVADAWIYEYDPGAAFSLP